MRTLRRNRQLAGNICLVVFAALLFSMLFAGAGAAGSNVEVKVQGSEEASVTLPRTAQSVEIRLQAATPTAFDPIWAQVRVGTTVYRTVYLTDVADATYAHQVYELVYNLAYSPLFMVYAPFHLDIWDGNELLSVFLTFEGPPPEVSFPPAPPVAPGQPVTVTPVVVGAVATAAVDSNAVDRQIRGEPQATVVSIRVPVTAGVEQVAVQLPSAAVNSIVAAERDLNIETQFAVFLLPKELLTASEIANQLVPGARVDLLVQAVPQAQADALLAARPALATPAGRVLELALRVADPAGRFTAVGTFRQRIWVSIPFEAARLGGVPAWKLGVYRLEEATGSWEFRGGRLDAAAGTVSAGLSSFSKYTVMAYDRTFADIRNHWGWRDIELMASRHVARGVDRDRFAPDRVITRAEFAVLLLRSLGVTAERPARGTFNDVTADRWYFAEVETARRLGLVVGFKDNTFRPGQRVTRQEIAAMISRVTNMAGKTAAITEAEANRALAGFGDAARIAPWARHAAAAAVQTGIVKGRSAAVFAPLANATRAESLVMLKRTLEATGEIK